MTTSAMLLARVAEQLYWAARYLERAETTARVVNQHTHLLVDLPTSVPLTWAPLLGIAGPGEAFATTHPAASEHDIVAFLLADPDNPSSLLSSVHVARTNLRSSREVLAREAWEAVNNLHLYVASHHRDGVDRWSRGRFLDHVIGEVHRFSGIVASSMGRDDAYQFLHLGAELEHADMVTRVLDAYGRVLLTPPTQAAHVEVQWAAVLRALSAMQSYYRRGLAPLTGARVVDFLLTDPDLPGSLAWCVAEVGLALGELPRAEAAAAAARGTRRQVDALRITSLPDLRQGLRDLREGLTAIHDEVATAYFPPPAANGSPAPGPRPTVRAWTLVVGEGADEPETRTE